MSHISVLIVGAGPTGLMLAYELARLGIAFRIIDKQPEQTKLSNAVALQARTLEIFKQIGLADDFLRVGQACRSLDFYDHGKIYARARLDKIRSIYPFILALPQAATETILNQKLRDLSHHVERSRELVEVHQNLGDVEAVVQHQDGVREIIRCEWLVGCDGAHSAVRAKTGFSFPGDDLQEQFLVADGTLDSFLRPDQIHIFSADGYMLGVFPLGSNQYRLGANLQLGYPRKLYTENEVKQLVSERSYDQFSARHIDWISPFWIHSKMTKEMRQGRIFLAGDAAHIHSPVGGQGMNTGIQDAHNLAWKLALVIQGRSDEKLLDTYQSERMPVIRQVVETTERFTRLLLLKNKFLLLLRKLIIKTLFKIPYTERYITERMTQISIRYKPNFILYTDSHITHEHPAVGERAPDVKLNHSGYFYNHLLDTEHHIVCFTGDKDIFKVADACKRMQSELLGPYKDLLVLHLVTPHALDEPINQIIDDSNIMHQTYNVRKPTVLVIRPDGYIGYRSQNLSASSLKNYFENYLLV